ISRLIFLIFHASGSEWIASTIAKNAMNVSELKTTQASRPGAELGSEGGGSMSQPAGCASAGSSRSFDPRNGRARSSVARPEREVRRSLRRLAESIDELAGVAADRRIEHLDVQRILRVHQRIAGTIEHEARRFDFLLHHFGVDPVQRVGIAHARSGRRNMIDHDEYTTGLERVEDL